MKTVAECTNWICAKRNGVYSGGMGRRRTQRVLDALGNPERDFLFVHVVGTSGKGSVATMTSSLLVAAGFVVGLQVTPYVCDIRERMQINNQLISDVLYIKYCNELRRVIDRMEANGDVFNYYDLATALSFYIFSRQKVQYAVVEAGVGGLNARTNAPVSNKTVVLTQIGLDHMKTLGGSLEQITRAKVGAIQHNSLVICKKLPEKLMAYARKHALQTSSKFVVVDTDKAIQSIEFDELGVTFNDARIFPGAVVRCGMIGEHMAANAALSISAVAALAQRDGFTFTKQYLAALTSAVMPGRLQIGHSRGSRIIVDGAHNTQKITAVVTALKQLYSGVQYDIVFACKKSRTPRELLAILEPVTKIITMTAFSHTHGIESHQPVELLRLWQELSDKPVQMCNNVSCAMHDLLYTDSQRNILVIGSLYLAGELLQSYADIFD